MIDPNAPWFKRPQKWDNVLQKRRSLFWCELNDNQRMSEMEYNNLGNKQILKSIQEQYNDRSSNSIRGSHDTATRTNQSTT